MIGEELSNCHRRISFASITALHVAYLLRRADAKSMSPLAPSSYEMQTKTDPSKAIVFAVVLCAFFFIGFISVYLRNCSESDSRSGGGRRGGDWSRGRGLDDAVVESFPVFAFSSIKEWKFGSGTLECAVCLSEFEESEMLRLIPNCNHVFHIDCIDAWLYSHATCPVCRAKLAQESEKLVEDEPSVTESIAAESSGRENSTDIDEARDHLAIDIDGDRTGDSEAIEAAMKREKRPRPGIAGKFPRSKSTGHSLTQLRDTTERDTLRLPDDVRKRMMAAASGRRLKRASSYDGGVSAAEGSTRRGWRSGGEGSSGRGRGSWTERWGLLVPKMGSVKSQNDNGEAI